jgi:hypothetical protein
LTAAQLETDPAKRRAALTAAAEKYRALLTPESHKLYAATTRPGVSPESPDPAAQFGLATASFYLGDYAAAQPIVAQLLNDRQLGPPQNTVEGGGEPVPNDQYWEATYILLKSNAELAKSTPNAAEVLAPTQTRLKQLFIEFGPQPGGRKWGALFEALRKEIAPDFVPPATEP